LLSDDEHNRQQAAAAAAASSGSRSSSKRHTHAVTLAVIHTMTPFVGTETRFYIHESQTRRSAAVTLMRDLLRRVFIGVTRLCCYNRNRSPLHTQYRFRVSSSLACVMCSTLSLSLCKLVCAKAIAIAIATARVIVAICPLPLRRITARPPPPRLQQNSSACSTAGPSVQSSIQALLLARCLHLHELALHACPPLAAPVLCDAQGQTRHNG